MVPFIFPEALSRFTQICFYLVSVRPSLWVELCFPPGDNLSPGGQPHSREKMLEVKVAGSTQPINLCAYVFDFIFIYFSLETPPSAILNSETFFFFAVCTLP